MWKVIGQERAVAVLSRGLAEGRLSHAYLFTGPAHIGKFTTALEFARAINCRGEDPPCHRCRQCRLLEEKEHGSVENKHPDVELVSVGGLCDDGTHKDHSADGSKDIRICQVRRIERVVSRTSFEGGHRVVIIDPADALNIEASNAFLKTLEEPPPSLVLILVTSREEALLPTVRSRCRRVPFSALSIEETARALREEWSAPEEEAGQIARLSGGRLGWAVNAWQDETVLPARAAIIDDAYRMTTAGRDERFAYAEELSRRFRRDREGVLSTLELWQSWWRDILLVASGHPELVADATELDRLGLLARKYTVEDVEQVLKAIDRTRRYLLDNVNPQLALEVLVLDFAASPVRKENVSPA